MDSVNEKIISKEYNCIEKFIHTEVTIISDNGSRHICEAMWDTGGLQSCISPQLCSTLALKPIKKRLLHSVTGVDEVGIYNLNVQLSDNIVLPDIPVLSTNTTITGYHMIIGMDIISRGNFSVTNENNRTIFTFELVA